MSMSAIERVIPLVGHLPPSIREALSRRVRELTGLGLITLSGVASAMLSLPTLAQPLNNADKSPATTQTRNAIVPSNIRWLGVVPTLGRKGGNQ